MEHVDHILIVDHDPIIRRMVAEHLQHNGMRTSVGANSREMHAVLDRDPVDLIVLDATMRGADGLLLCRSLCAGNHRSVPVLVLTSRNDTTERIICLEMGADDYVVKPFSARELLAHINAVLRRTRMLPPNLRISEASALLSFGCWRLDTSVHHLIDQNDNVVMLSSAMYRLLQAFLDHPQRILSREQLLNLTQARSIEQFDRSIDLLVSRLRQRLCDDAQEPLYIRTVRSEGYVFCQPVTIIGGDTLRMFSASFIHRAKPPSVPHVKSDAWTSPELI
jgi:two-component system, OmpR family, response regulator